MCIKNILNMISKAFAKKPLVEAPPPVIPHPEEQPDYTKTVENVNVDDVLNKWLVSYNVSEEYHDYWKQQIVVTVTDTIPYPAGTYANGDGKRHLIIRPEWLNPGVIAHEQAHNSYALLTDEQKAEFEATYTPLISTDKYIKLLYSTNTYGLTSVVEGHAEIYRYLCEKMPDVLKQFYPKLF